MEKIRIIEEVTGEFEDLFIPPEEIIKPYVFARDWAMDWDISNNDEEDIY